MFFFFFQLINAFSSWLQENDNWRNGSYLEFILESYISSYFLKAFIVDVDYGVPEISGICTCVVTLVSCLVPVSIWYQNTCVVKLNYFYLIKLFEVFMCQCCVGCRWVICLTDVWILDCLCCYITVIVELGRRFLIVEFDYGLCSTDTLYKWRVRYLTCA